MKIEKAINQLHELIQDRESFMVGEYESYLDRDKQALQTAVKALEKQLPKKPIAKPYFYGKSYYCSECKHYVCADYNTKESYCSKCGQALDWRNGNATN